VVDRKERSSRIGRGPVSRGHRRTLDSLDSLGQEQANDDHRSGGTREAELGRKPSSCQDTNNQPTAKAKAKAGTHKGSKSSKNDKRNDPTPWAVKCGPYRSEWYKRDGTPTAALLRAIGRAG